MGGSSDQVVGYKYYAGLQYALGNTIERVININADKTGWIFITIKEVDLLNQGDTTIIVDKTY